MSTEPCRRCKGQGFTFLDSLIDGFANFLQSWVGKPFRSKCSRCRGSGFERPMPAKE